MALNINDFYKALQDEKFYSIQDLEEMSGISHTTIKNYIDDGRIPTARYDLRQYVTGRNIKKYLRGERDY